MKKTLLIFLSLLLAVTMTAGTVANAAADEGDHGLDRLLKEEELAKEAVLPQLEKIMQEAAAEQYSGEGISYGAVDTIASYDIDNAYRVNMLEPLLLTSIKENGDFKSAISTTVQWKIPIVTTQGEPGIAILLEEDGKLSYMGIGVGEATQNWYITKADIESAVSNSTIIKKELTTLQIVHSYMYDTAFVYLSDGENEYLIPFSYLDKEIKIESGTVYSVSQIEKKFNRCFDEQQLIDSPMSNGGAPFRDNQSNRYLLILGGFFLTTAAAVTVIMICRKKR